MIKACSNAAPAVQRQLKQLLSLRPEESFSCYLAYTFVWIAVSQVLLVDVGHVHRYLYIELIEPGASQVNFMQLSR